MKPMETLSTKSAGVLAGALDKVATNSLRLVCIFIFGQPKMPAKLRKDR